MDIKHTPRIRTYKRLIIVFIVVMAAFSIIPVCNYFRGHTKDYGLFYHTGQSALHHGDIYTMGQDKTFRFMYPPTAAALLAIVSSLGFLPMIVILVLVNSAAWFASVFLAVYLATGKALQHHPLLYLVPTACCVPYVWDTYLLGQPNLLLLAFMLGAFVCLRHKKEWGAGILIALAASIKAFPILALVYLIYRRWWKAVFFTIVSLCFFLVLLPAPFRGLQRNLQDIKTWNQGMVLHYEADSIAQRPNRGYSWRNQSLVAVANRLLRPVDAFRSKTNPRYVNLVNLEFKHVNMIIVSIGLGLCLFYLASMPRYTQRTANTDSIEYAMLIILILILTPLSFTYFYVWLLYPLMVVFNLLLTAPHPSRERNVMIVWFVACSLLLSFMLPVPGFVTFKAMGCTFWACILLLVGLGLKLQGVKRHFMNFISHG